ncbi:MAG: hypothetical protein AB9861_00435 [Methanosarcina sp.]
MLELKGGFYMVVPKEVRALIKSIEPRDVFSGDLIGAPVATLAEQDRAARSDVEAAEEYRQKARDELLRTRTESEAGFRDQYGYIVDYDNGQPTTLGEGTLHTAIAVVALATGNYHQDAWEIAAANARVKELLTSLLNRSWGNRDNLGREHPIRHPDDIEYNKDGTWHRASPLTKDSFGAIVAAAYYAYTCPNSDEDVRATARELMTKWTEYLVLFQWRTHSTYIPGEFESKTIDGKEYYKNIFSENGGRVMRKGPESYMLLPHEVYALQNVAARLGIPTSHWNIWLNGMSAELKQMIIDYAAPYIAEAAGWGLDYILQRLSYAIPYSIQLGPDSWNYGKFKGVFEVRIPSDMRERVIVTFKDAIRDLMREIVRLDNYTDPQAGEVLGLVVNRILNLLPDILGPDSWRSILTGGIQQVVPWISGLAWVEAATFLATQQLLKWKGLDGKAELRYDVISYTLWSYASECECRPEMAEILRPTTQEFFSFLRGNSNPNGLWAWLAEDSGRVQEQLRLFESKPQRYWWKFAYGSTEFDKWVVEPEDEQAKEQAEGLESPRLDYLVLNGLAEKGSPLGLGDIPNDWWDKFKTAVEDASRQFLDAIKDQFDQLGSYTREAINDAGDLIRETWANTLQYTQEQLRQDRLVLKQTWDQVGDLVLKMEQVDGKWIEEYWKRDTEKYWKGVWSHRTATADEMIQRMIVALDDKWSEEYWKRDTEKYWKGIWPHRTATADEMIQRMIVALDDKWSEEYWKRDTEKYWKGVWPHRTATADEMIQRMIVALDDKWSEEYWKRDTEKYWKGVWPHRTATADEMIQRMIVALDDKWSKEYWKRDTEKYWKGVWADSSGMAEKMTTRIVINLEKKLSSEYWNRPSEKYWRGVWADTSGSADKMRERYIRRPNDYVSVEVWNEAGDWGRSVFNAVGDLIEKVGPLALGGLPGWWPPKVDIPDIPWRL